MKNLSFFNKLIFLFNLLCVASLIVAYSASYISPNELWLPALFGLFYPVVFFINLLFIFYWALQRKWLFLLSFISALVGSSEVNNYIGINFLKDDTPTDSSEKIKIMSYNVRCFDLYNWTNNKSTRDKIFKLLKDENPDILNLQEFYTEDSDDFVTHDTIIKFLKAVNSHIEIGVTSKRIHHWGLATYSRYPIVNKGKIDFESKGSNMCIFTDLKIGNDTIRIYNCHFQSIHFSKNDYKYLQDLQDSEKDTEWEGTFNILKRLKLAFGKRSRQTDAVAAHMSTSPYKIIITGDFNDTPSSYSYSVLSENLLDAFKEKGRGFGKTYINNIFPLRIDYILTSTDMMILDFKELRYNYSDHYPISSIINIDKK